jgi:hypothetical protein
MTIMIKTHPEMQRGLDGPARDDRRWFHEHPGEVVRLRPQLPEEVEAHASMNELVGYVPPYLEALGVDGLPLPRTWMAVIDLLRVDNRPQGPNGESGRVRMECPEPINALMREQIQREAIAFGRLWWKKTRRLGRRAKGRGFG